MLIGDESQKQYGQFFKGGCLPSFPDVQVASVEGLVSQYMDDQGLGLPVRNLMTVKSVTSEILKCQGCEIVGDSDTAFQKCHEDIVKMLKNSLEIFIPNTNITGTGTSQLPTIGSNKGVTAAHLSCARSEDVRDLEGRHVTLSAQVEQLASQIEQQKQLMATVMEQLSQIRGGI